MTLGNIRAFSDRMRGVLELDIAEELGEFFSGEDFGKEKGDILILRKYRRDNNLSRIPCAGCNNLASIQGGIEGCPYCQGFGYIWDEQVVEGYVYSKKHASFGASFNFAREYSRTFSDKYMVVLENKHKAYEGDHIYTLNKTSDGKIVMPMKRSYGMIVATAPDIGIVHNKREFTLLIMDIMVKNEYIKTNNES